MREVKCPYCGFKSSKYGRTKKGTQRWFCHNCSASFTSPINKKTKQLKQFLNWLFSKDIQANMPSQGRTFRRKINELWNIWALPPKIESPSEIVYVDGIYLARKVCILICCDDCHVLGWYICRYECSRAWEALLQRIAPPKMVVSDGGSGFAKALCNVCPHVIHQRCLYHAYQQVIRYTTHRPKTLAGNILRIIARDLLHIKTQREAITWIQRLMQWRIDYRDFLKEMTKDDDGKLRPKHERLLKAERSLQSLIKKELLFKYLDIYNGDSLGPSTNNKIEGAVNASLRSMLRNHRGLSLIRRIKAVYWWCYMHSPKPLSENQILDVMPTDESISRIYEKIRLENSLVDSVPNWGDAIVWEELHIRDVSYQKWD